MAAPPAASAAFLGLSPGSRDPGAASRGRRRRRSRWRSQCPAFNLPKMEPPPSSPLALPNMAPPILFFSRLPEVTLQRFRSLSPTRRRRPLRGLSKMAAAPEASAAFLGFSPGSRDPGAASRGRRRRSRCPRNRKKGWKRSGGPEERLGREIGDFLEDVALQQRTAGGLLREQPDEGLFFLDTGNDKKGRGQQPLHVDLVLQPDSKVAPPKNILSQQVPNGRKERRRREFWAEKAKKGIFPGAERRLLARIRRGGGSGGAPPSENDPSPQKKPLEKGRSDPHRSFYDIWGAHNPLEQPLRGQDGWYLQQTQKGMVKRPERLLVKPPQGTPPVEVIGPGGSYNPTLEDHQALLRGALENEERRRRLQLRVEKQLQLPPGTTLATQESQFQELCQGLLEESGGEEEEEDKGPPTPETSTPPKPESLGTSNPPKPESLGTSNPPKPESLGTSNPPKPESLGTSNPLKLVAPGKKTERQRRREKEARALARGRLEASRGRLRLQQLFGLRRLRRELRSRELKLQELRRLRRQRRLIRDQAPRRLGRLRYEPPPLELLLSQELPDCLRTLKPEGNLLLDRFKSFQRRNLIEPRERAKFKRRYRLKYVEKRAFRHIQL